MESAALWRGGRWLQCGGVSGVGKEKEENENKNETKFGSH